MFSDDSINIHYQVPTSKLLKMNTFNEFEVNRIKKYYQDKLSACRHGANLKRCSSSGRSLVLDRHQVRCSSALGGGQQQQQQHSSGGSSSSEAALVWLHYRHKSQSATAREAAAAATGAAGIDLNRYQHALAFKRPAATGGQLSRAGRNRWAAGGARFARCKADFVARHERELALKQGDLVELLEPAAADSGGWCLVDDCQSGLQGLVPLDYLDYSVGCALAKRDIPTGQEAQFVTAANASQTRPIRRLLPMVRGEPITLLRRLRGCWYEATNTRQSMGIVWSNDLEIIKQPANDNDQQQRPNVDHHGPGGSQNNQNINDHDDDDQDFEQFLVDDQNQQQQLYRRQADSRGSLLRARSASGGRSDGRLLEDGGSQIDWPPQLDESDCCCRQPGDSDDNPALDGNTAWLKPRRSSSTPYIANNGKELPADMPGQSPVGTDLPRLCRAKYAYKPRQADELELRVGDILLCVHECDDGWFIGSSYSTKEAGSFPGNFVEPV